MARRRSAADRAACRTEPPTNASWRPSLHRYLTALLIVAVCTAASSLLNHPLDLGNVVAIYLLGVVVVAASLGRGPAVFAALLGALAVDLLLLPPVFGLLPTHAPHLLTLVVMLLVAFTVGGLAARLREELKLATERERNTADLHGLARDLARAADAAAVAAAIDRHVQSRFRCRTALFAARNGGLSAIGHGDTPPDPELLLAANAAMHGEAEAARRPGPPGSSCHELATGKGVVGALVVRPVLGAGATEEPDPGHLRAFANLAATALERTLFAEAAQAAVVTVEHERLRSALLSSVSHDLRTPIAAVIGASSTLLRERSLDDDTRTSLLESIHQMGARLERQVRNLLDMTRLEAGTVQPRFEWTPVEDVVGAALTRLEEPLRDRELQVQVAADLPPVPMDGMLIELVLVNLLENALRHTPGHASITLSARADGGHLQFAVADRGPGITGLVAQRIAAKLQGNAAGAGLGLAICRAIVSLHSGSIRFEDHPGGGARFVVTLPLERPSLPPLVPVRAGEE